MSSVVNHFLLTDLLLDRPKDASLEASSMSSSSAGAFTQTNVSLSSPLMLTNTVNGMENGTLLQGQSSVWLSKGDYFGWT